MKAPFPPHTYTHTHMHAHTYLKLINQTFYKNTHTTGLLLFYLFFQNTPQVDQTVGFVPHSNRQFLHEPEV